jgi:hypothetical protein
VESKSYRYLLSSSFGGDRQVGLRFSEALRRSIDDACKAAFC